MSGRILAALAAHAARTPSAPALIGDRETVDYATLHDRVDRLSQWLVLQGVRRCALLGENSPEWLVADLAAWKAGVVLVPVPPFFTDAQRAHVLSAAGIEHLLFCGDDVAGVPGDRMATPISGIGLMRLAHHAAATSVSPGTCKITFTSGTTGTPKGVCLDSAQLDAVTEALAARIHEAPCLADAVDTHFTLLPLATLLENVAGAYVPLLLGKRIVVRSGEHTGLTGSSQLDLARLVSTLHRDQPNSLIVLPQILRGLVIAAAKGVPMPSSLRFIAVGGATTAPSLLRRARSLGLPVYEGYGLSECASVVALNAPGSDEVGTVGRVLPHVAVRIVDGVIEVKGNTFSGYLGQTEVSDSPWLDTGDLGHIDDDGFLHVTGRRKHLLITGFGRNVSPEWVEAELSVSPLIAQVMVVGEGQSHLGAIVVPSRDIPYENLAVEIALANARLPDYAWVRRFTVADQPFTAENQLLTDNGRLRRDRIAARYANALAALFQPSQIHETPESIHDVL